MSYYRNESKPRKRVKKMDEDVRLIAEVLLEEAKCDIGDVKLYAVDQRRGTYNKWKKVIKIPVWIYNEETVERKCTNACVKNVGNYDVYYIAHELAHAVIDVMKSKMTYGGLMMLPRDNGPHGKLFMDTFKMICPKDLWHYELIYKPRNAANAGISINIGD